MRGVLLALPIALLCWALIVYGSMKIWGSASRGELHTMTWADR